MADRAHLPVLAAEDARLSTCVQCGFCLPACPTYLRLGDEADSPRGRIRLMRAVADGRITADDPEFRRHIDLCLGCRACESACPPGVEYGALVERARDDIARASSIAWTSRLVLAIVRKPLWTRFVTAVLRLVRATRIPRLLAREMPHRFAGLRIAAAMLDATRPRNQPAAERQLPRARTSPAQRVAVLTGCVQAGLLGAIGAATRRVLAINGFDIVDVPAQRCCGALHDHAGQLETGRELARANIAAFEASEVELVVVDAAGCGAAMKDYAALLEADRAWHERARQFSRRVRDVSELLAERDLVRGAAVAWRVTYDAPCHLVHGQRIASPPLALLASIPGVELVPLRGSDTCCGGAGIWGMQHAELAATILDDKLAAIAETGADVVATGNAGCIMQIGGGLVAREATTVVLHPIQVLDESYRRAGYYEKRSTIP